MTSPDFGKVIYGNEVNLSFESGETVIEEWHVYAGTSLGSNDIVDSGDFNGDVLNYTIGSLPRDNNLIYIRLWYKQSGWEYLDFEFTSGILRIIPQGDYVWGTDAWGVAV